MQDQFPDGVFTSYSLKIALCVCVCVCVGSLSLLKYLRAIKTTMFFSFSNVLFAWCYLSVSLIPCQITLSTVTGFAVLKIQR